MFQPRPNPVPPPGALPASPAKGADDGRPPFGLHRGKTGVWICDFYVRGRRIRRATGTHDLAEAVRVCIRWRDGGEEALPPPRAARHTCDDLIALLEAEHQAGRISTGTLRNHVDRLRFLRDWYWRETGSELVLERIDTALINRYLAWRRATPITRNGRPQGDRRLPSRRTVMHDLDTFRALFRRAVQRGWMDEEPTAKIPRDRAAYRARVTVVNHTALGRFFEELRRRCAQPGTRCSGLRLIPDFCEVTLACGLRREETRLLTRADIDLGRQTVRIRPKRLTLTVVLWWDEAEYEAFCRAAAEGRRPSRPRLPECLPLADAAAGTWHPDLGVLVATTTVVWQPKGGGREREVPIPPRARALFERLVATDLADWYPDAPPVAARRALGLPMPELLFPSAEGWLLRANLNREVNLAARAAGIGALRVHDLRHIYATLLRAAGVELATIQRLLGHEDIATTQMYAHYTDAEGRRAVEHLAW